MYWMLQRSVTAVSTLLSKEQKQPFLDETKKEYEKLA